METLEINKRFNTHEDMEEYERKLREEYMVILVNRTAQNAGEKAIYGIDSIMHFGKRK